MAQQVASGIHKSSKAPAYLEDPVRATVDVTELFPAVPGAEPPFALFVASAALLHAAAYSSGGSVTLLCLRLYDPTQTNLSLSAQSHDVFPTTVNLTRSALPHRADDTISC